MTLGAVSRPQPYLHEYLARAVGWISVEAVSNDGCCRIEHGVVEGDFREPWGGKEVLASCRYRIQTKEQEGRPCSHSPYHTVSGDASDACHA